LLQDEPLSVLESMEDKVFEVHVAEKDLNEIHSRYKVSNVSSDKDGATVRIVNDRKPA
jgi:hypothetical protein